MDSALVLGLAGLGTTTAAPLLATWLRSKVDRGSWRRDQRVAVFADAIAYAESLRVLTERAAFPLGTFTRGTPDIQHVHLITARIRLVAPGASLEKWRAMCEAEEAFRWTLEEDYPWLGQDDPMKGVPDTDTDLVKLQAAIDDFVVSARL